ncbi:hypothetical protein MRX96_016261 [Rhipicephalus microplus]
MVSTRGQQNEGPHRLPGPNEQTLPAYVARTRPQRVVERETRGAIDVGKGESKKTERDREKSPGVCPVGFCLALTPARQDVTEERNLAHRDARGIGDETSRAPTRQLASLGESDDSRQCCFSPLMSPQRISAEPATPSGPGLSNPPPPSWHARVFRVTRRAHYEPSGAVAPNIGASGRQRHAHDLAMHEGGIGFARDQARKSGGRLRIVSPLVVYSYTEPRAGGCDGRGYVGLWHASQASVASAARHAHC